MMVDLHQNTPEMTTHPTLSTPQHSCAAFKPPKISPLSPLPSAISPVPTLILPPCLDAEHVLPHKLNTAMRHNSSTSSLTMSSHSEIFHRSTLVSTLQSPRACITEICNGTLTVGHDNRTSICDSDQKLKCSRKRSASEKSTRPIHHTFRLFSPVESIPMLHLPPSVSDAYCLPSDKNKSQPRDSAVSSPITSTHVNDFPSLVLPSSLPCIGDDISALYLPRAVWEE